MYQEFFKLKGPPFPANPSAAGCVMLAEFKTEFERCVEGIGQMRGPVLVTGPSGCGKSTLVALLERHFSGQLRTVVLNCASIASRRELVQCLLFELGLSLESGDLGELRLKLIDHLKSPEHCPHGLLLLVDEAHNQTGEVLEELRLMTNMVCGGRTQVRLLLAGLNELDENLAQLEAFSQRIAVRVCLGPLGQADTALLVLAKTGLCGRDGREIFQPLALQKIHELSDGIPRVVCQLADVALETAARAGQPQIGKDVIDLAWRELQRLPAEEPETGPTSFPGGLETESGEVLEFGSLSDDDSMAAARSGFDTAADDGSWSAAAESSTELTDAQHEPEVPAGVDEVTISVESMIEDLIGQLKDLEPEPDHPVPAGSWSESELTETPAGPTVVPGPPEIPPPEAETDRDRTTCDAHNLFGEDFEHEEPVTEIPTHQVAEQNQQSSQTSAGGLQDLPEPTHPAAVESESEIVLPTMEFPATGESFLATCGIPAPCEDPDSETGGTPTEAARELENTFPDDRDMLVIDYPDSGPGITDGPTTDGPEKREHPETAANNESATGPADRVVRMDYKDLFRQLREDQTDQPG